MTDIINNRDRLRLFAEMACYNHVADSAVVYADPTHPGNKQCAERWLQSELGFLGGRDKDELIEVWGRVIEDSRDARMLFSAVKLLQEKYGEQ